MRVLTRALVLGPCLCLCLALLAGGCATGPAARDDESPSGGTAKTPMAIAEKACERLQRVRFPTRPRTAVIRGLGEIARAQRAGQMGRARALSDALAGSCLNEYHLRADAARTLALVDSSESMLDAEGKRRFRAFVAAGDYGATVGCGQALLAHRPRVCTSMPAPRPYVASATPRAPAAPAAPGTPRVALAPAAKPSPASPTPASPTRQRAT